MKKLFFITCILVFNSVFAAFLDEKKDEIERKIIELNRMLKQAKADEQIDSIDKEEKSLQILKTQTFKILESMDKKELEQLQKLSVVEKKAEKLQNDENTKQLMGQVIQGKEVYTKNEIDEALSFSKETFNMEIMIRPLMEVTVNQLKGAFEELPKKDLDKMMEDKEFKEKYIAISTLTVDKLVNASVTTVYQGLTSNDKKIMKESYKVAKIKNFQDVYIGGVTKIISTFLRTMQKNLNKKINERLKKTALAPI